MVKSKDPLLIFSGEIRNYSTPELRIHANFNKRLNAASVGSKKVVPYISTKEQFY